MSLMDVGKKYTIKTPNETAEEILQYEKHYHEVVRDYMPEIEKINGLLKDLRAEEKAFWDNLHEIEKVMENDEVLSPEIKAEWLAQYRISMQESFEMSKKIIEHYIVDNLEEFKSKLKKALR